MIPVKLLDVKDDSVIMDRNNVMGGLKLDCIYKIHLSGVDIFCIILYLADETTPGASCWLYRQLNGYTNRSI